MMRWLALLPALCVLAMPAAIRGESLYGEDVEEAFSDTTRVSDPLEPMNRVTFALNEFIDHWFLEPVAVGWDTLVPGPVQDSLDHFFDNLAMPRRIANDLLQGKVEKAGDDIGRFMVNTSFGLLGFFDPASALGHPPADEDFGQTLGVWGVPPGPYLVLPFYGPSNPRDTFGLAFESFVMSPENYYLPFYVSYARTAVNIVNSRALVIEDLRAERAAALDFYAAARNAFVSYRANQVRDRADAPEEEDEDFYYFDDEE